MMEVYFDMHAPHLGRGLPHRTSIAVQHEYTCVYTAAVSCRPPSSIAGADPGGAHAPPFGTEQALNEEVYRALSARSYSDTAHISV